MAEPNPTPGHDGPPATSDPSPDPWDREFGPPTPAGPRRVIGLVAVAAFIGLIIYAVLTTP